MKARGNKKSDKICIILILEYNYIALNTNHKYMKEKIVPNEQMADNLKNFLRTSNLRKISSLETCIRWVGENDVKIDFQEVTKEIDLKSSVFTDLVEQGYFLNDIVAIYNEYQRIAREQWLTVSAGGKVSGIKNTAKKDLQETIS